MVINDQGSITEAVMYQPYGMMSDVSGVNSSAIPVREKFTGKESDQDGALNGAPGIGLFHFGGRVYDSELGIFLTPDPFEEFFNLYSYTNGNPINLIDPTGFESKPIEFTEDEVEVAEANSHLTYDPWLQDNWNRGIMIPENTYVNIETNRAQQGNYNTYSAEDFEFNSDVNHSFGSRSAADLNKDMDQAIRPVFGVVQNQLFLQSLYKLKLTNNPSTRMSKTLAETQTSKAISAMSANFANEKLLLSHFDKHGVEFGAKTAPEYLQIGRDIMKNGTEVNYIYKGETRVGYTQFMGNSSTGTAKFGFVGTNADGAITTIHVESGNSFWKMLNGTTEKIINGVQ